MGSSDGFVLAVPVSGLLLTLVTVDSKRCAITDLMHFNSDGPASRNFAFPCDSFGSSRITANIVGRDARDGRVTPGHADTRILLVDAVDP